MVPENLVHCLTTAFTVTEKTNSWVTVFAIVVTYRKIPKIRPGAYIFQRPFLRGLYSEGLIYGGNLRFKIDWICLMVGSKFLLCFTLYLRAIFLVQAPGGLIFGGAYTWRGLFSEFYGMYKAVGDNDVEIALLCHTKTVPFYPQLSWHLPGWFKAIITG